MSLAEPENPKPRVAVDNTSRGLPNDLGRFAKAGLELKITDYRQFCEDLQEGFLALGLTVDEHQIADILFSLLTSLAPPPNAPP